MSSHGKRGITNLDMLKVNDPGASLYTTAPQSQAALGDDDDFHITVWVDSFPQDDRWVPPLHGDDVDSFSDNLMKSLDEQKDNYAEFTRILETNGCLSSSLAEDILPCFKDERELQHPAIRGEACGNDDISSLSTSFYYKLEKGRIIRPSGAELRRCLDVIPENLGDIAWRDVFQSKNDEAVEAAKLLDWETACECYEACLMLVQLEAVKERVSAKIQAWLVLWVCVPLAYLYQFRLRRPGNYSRCVLLYDQVLEHLNKTDDENLVDLYYSVIWHRRMVLFQWSYAIDDQSLVAKFMRFKAFSEVQIVEDFYHFPGFIMLQRIINFWGRRTRRGLEGDMRVAFCTNLEHLYRELKQWSEAVLWTNEKWRWICTFSDVLHELNLQWRLRDVESLVHAGRVEEAQTMISALEESAAATSLPEAVLFKIRYWKARILAVSDVIEADGELQKLRNELQGKVLTENEELLVFVKLEISKLNYQRLRSAKILERAPVGVENGEEWDDDIDITATDLLKEISPFFKVAVDISSNVELESAKVSYLFHLIQGEQLLMSLKKPFTANRIEEYRDRVHEAADHFQICFDLMAKQEKDAVPFRDEVFDHEHEVETRRTSDIKKIDCYIYLGYCAIFAARLKPQGDKYDENFQKEMHPKAEIALTNLVKANNYLQEALSLAVGKGYDFEVSIVREALGHVHYRRAHEFFEWLKHFKDSMPLFREKFAMENGKKSEVKLFVRRICGNIYHEHWHALELSEYQVSCIFYQYPPAPASCPSSSSSPAPQNPFPPFESHEVVKVKINGVVRHCLTEELLELALRRCLIGLMKGTIQEIKQSTDYFEGSLINIHGVEKSAPFYTAEEQIQRVPHLSISEKMKKMYTYLQRLIVWAVAIKDMIGDDAELHQLLISFTADPAIVEFLRLKRGDLTRKALLWAERGRSRSLVQQLPASKSTHGMINMAGNLQDEYWNRIRNSRLSCGENTVFVEYNFDTAHEYISDIIDFNIRIVTWIVYVVTKDDEVHMLCNEVRRLSDLSDALKDINRKLSEGAKDANTVKKALLELYGILIEPISDLLRGMDAEDKLVFAADEVLTNVPFSILLDAKTEKYLFQNHTVSFTPSLQILEHCHRRLKLLQESEFKVEPSLALGDPAYLREKERLKGTYFEVQKISSLFKKGSVKVLTGTEATVDNLLRQSNMATDTVQGFIHVAAHNHVDKKYKAGSLQLAHPSAMHHKPPSEDASSTETATKISDLDELRRGASEVEGRKARQKARELKAKAEAEAEKLAHLPSERIMQRGSDWRSCMVVLSACNSAKGYVLASEGVVGLPRAFLLAGVPCIVASQWKLEDQSSSELMVKFYREMSGGTTDAASALRAAMLHMMKGSGSSDQVVDVYKWGGYLVWGLPTVTLSPRVMK